MKPDTKGHVVYESVFTKCPEQVNPETEREMISGCQGLGGDTPYGCRGNFRDDEKFLELDCHEGCTTW